MGLFLLGSLVWGCTAAPPAPSSTVPSAGPSASLAGPTAPPTEQPVEPSGEPASPDTGPASPDPGPPSPSAGATTPDPSATPTTPFEPSPSAAVRPLPECRYADRPTRHTDQDSWPITLLDPIYRLPADYVPERLVSTTRAGLQAGYEVRPEVVDDLRAMAEASRDADAEIAVRSAYRSYGEQAGAFAHWTRELGYDRALRVSARPGHSEHQLGTTLDFRSADSLQAPWDYDDWGDTPAGAWMRENSWRYGFLMTYPRGMSEETCYDYESWHFRYVGRELAAAVHESGHSLRRYLWDNFEAPANGE